MRHGDHLGVCKDDSAVFVAITMRAGRGPELKRALYRRIAELVHERTGTAQRNVVVTVTENTAVDWSFGDGEAQYAPAGQEPAGALP
ncbi:tautomerase family protein [Streptomyces sp. NPDC007251]|uniref:tautomerase family protein n=1 Tax=Streptomyces sp. NPDC007251 TaxID=3154483 RepID=UPI00340079DC